MPIIYIYITIIYYALRHHHQWNATGHDANQADRETGGPTSNMEVKCIVSVHGATFVQQ